MELDSVNKEILVDLEEKYVKVRKLLDEHSKLDPESEPYKSKYAAADILKEMQIKLVRILDENITEHDRNIVTAMLAVIWLNMGIISVDTEELAAGEEQLTNCVDLLVDRELRPEAILVILSALNQLGILWAQRDNPKESQKYLEKAEKIYKDFTAIEKSDSAKPVFMAALFNLKDDDDDTDAEEIVERLHTLTLYYLAQIYGTLKDHLKSAVYCHMTLKRQLNHEDLDCVDWALNAATLSQYFMEKGGFRQAKHHLAAASYILQKYEDELRSLDDTEEVVAAKWETFRHRSADVARCWAKYGILLLSTSKERLMHHADDETSEMCSEISKMQLDEKSGVTEECIENLRFTKIEKEIETIANQLTDKYALDFNDARTIFLNSQQWLDEAKKYYTLESHASDHVQVIQDVSQLFKFLSFFEEDEDRQSKMHKRRIDALEKIVTELNPQYYQTVCRQLWIELGEVYCDILDIKLERLQASNERPTAQALTKINNLARSAIGNFQNFLDSLVDPATHNFPDKFSEDLVRPALFAYFFLGRLHYKIITPDKHAQLENLRNSLNAYKALIGYCEKDEKAAELMSVELSVCKDFVNLLPLKIEKLTRELV
ncbi:KIF-binding protein-like [Diprion similis]|uniref:KIF-binding protein-like n=1 Tax=Diprion similis TaxID=362088 RepID=UPI001EF8E703|nr:KIF-binding protein-like [Diprion similis]